MSIRNLYNFVKLQITSIKKATETQNVTEYFFCAAVPDSHKKIVNGSYVVLYQTCRICSTTSGPD